MQTTYRLIIAFALLQAALLGLMAKAELGDCITSSDVRAMVAGPPLVSGGTLDAIVIRSTDTSVVIHLRNPRSETILILSGCAACNLETIRNWERSARLRNARLITVLETPSNHLDELKRDWQLQGTVYANHGYWLYKRLGVKRLPMAVVLSRQGTILEVLQ
jgi:hypothetical protein